MIIIVGWCVGGLVHIFCGVVIYNFYGTIIIIIIIMLLLSYVRTCMHITVLLIEKNSMVLFVPNCNAPLKIMYGVAI